MESQETGMIYMIRIPLVLLLLSSCSIISFGYLPEVVKNSIIGVDIEITDEFYNAQPYSFAKMKIGKSIVAITILSNVRNGTYLWIAGDGERIHTRNGKIIMTEGLQHDVEVLDISNLGPSSYRDFNSKSGTFNEILLQLDNPHAIIQQSLSTTEVGIDQSFFNTMLYKESFSSGELAWNKDNFYWVDPTGRVVRTEQYIHPRMPKVVIEFFYK